MKRRSIFIAAIFELTILVALWSCAKQGYPSGGPRDTRPPVSIGSKPANESRNFNRQGFYVEFDEYIVLKNANDNVLVSPPLKQKPDYTVKGKGVQVSWTDTLIPNTTYLFQFKNAIADFNEGNLLPSFEYVFSTGNMMDTLMIAGRTENARTGKPWSESLSVMAYREERFTSDSCDTIAVWGQPDYVTRTDKEGHFAFHYIPAGRYRLIALEDKNRDLRIGRAEAAAWDTSFFTALDSVDSTAMPLLRMSIPDRRVQRLLKAEFSGKGSIIISTLLPMVQPELHGEDFFFRQNEQGDTLRVWLKDEQRDSALLVLRDASGINDTLKLKYRAPSRSRGRGRNTTQQKKEPLVKPLFAGQAAYYDDLRIAFSMPVTAKSDSIMCSIMRLKDSSVSIAPITIDNDGLGARINTNLHSGERYSIHLRDSLFADLYGHPSDSLTVNLSPKDYGILTLHVDNLLGTPLVIEVLDKRDTVATFKSLPGNGEVRFDHLPAGEYRLRAIIDTDSNGLWTPGDYLLGRQPEEMMMYEKTLQLREKWELEERWTIGRRQPEIKAKPRKIENLAPGERRSRGLQPNKQ